LNKPQIDAGQAQARKARMKRVLGALLLIIGFVPIALLFHWINGMYVVGFSLDTRGELTAAAFLLIEVACIWLGARLLLRSSRN